MKSRCPINWVALLATSLCLLVVVPGCGSALVGDWRITDAPVSADQYISQIRFRDDKSYTGVVTVRGKEPVLLDGNYSFNGFKLHLKRLGKQDHTYGATFVVGGTLKIRDGSTSYSLKKQ